MATSPRPETFTVPVVLTRSRLRMLIRLWEAGYENGIHTDRREGYAARELVRYGYAELNPDSKNHYRITQEGIDRLEAPMRLYKPVRPHLRLVK
jgi:hypothetical protein